MNPAIRAMLDAYGNLDTPQDEEYALQEIIQLITLWGLHRGGFFEQAAFYGGTALRILYGLNRFSEDMDFCLRTPTPEFRLNPYFSSIEDELARFGFSAKVTEKRSGVDAPIESAFVKQNTLEGLLVIERSPRALPRGQLIRVRLEVDKHNPPGATYVKKLVKLPVPFLVGTLDEPSLFAGKVHALLARAYLNRVKGRDYYDFAFYLARGTPVNATYLEAKLRDSGHCTKEESLTREELVKMLHERFSGVDFGLAAADIRPFIPQASASSLAEWDQDLFSALADTLEFRA